tara:strand:- start:2717 stop:3307 length:591 start_codon:yes stop_codon:yes gene_type:complete
MIMTFIRILKWTSPLRALMFVCISSLITLSTTSNAHILNETTAQVVLRDGQVEVKVYTDFEHLISALQSNQAWLMGDIDAVMPENLNESQQEAFVVAALKKRMNLKVNGKTLSFDHVIFEAVTLEGASLKSVNLGSKSHEKSSVHTREIIFQATHSFSQVSKLSISFHKSLGTVHTSFVKPQYKLLGAGETAQMIF